MVTNEDNIKLVEEHITIRFNPFIYAFSTNTIPNYLKVGDTFRGVDTRIGEWQKIIASKLYPQIVQLTEEYRHKALLSNEIYFRDYSVHEYLETIGKHRIEDEEIRKLYSQEFFEDTSVDDVEAAIKAITDDFASEELNKKYTYYKVGDNQGATFHGDNSKEWKLRPNQSEVVQNFLTRGEQKELLMYAVMRFGKSFTAMSCALATKARKVLIVSAKADVVGEWQKTVETPQCFKGFKFVCDDDFKTGFNIEDELNKSSDSKVAVFLTLQNLTGKSSDGQNIKKRLQQVFETNFDVIIVDETHYGAWANSYGEPLKDADEDVIKQERREYKKFDAEVAKLHCSQKLHLSGTPYNLLYDNKFTEENIIATCQFKDILRDKAEWDKEHFDDIENGVINPDTGKSYQEYDNPYFGFPNMLRFAFNLPEETRQCLSKLRTAWTLNDLFETKVENGIAKFNHEQEILELLKAIDGSKQVSGVLGFLNIPKIKNNDVCKHMVFVLPRKHACDAMADLLNAHSAEFVNLLNYTVLNITGHNMPSELDSVDKVKTKIAELEKNGQKTITLTVYKMLTGVTVKEWDTMIMLKNTSSAQEYDQAIFRIQNQYVEECVASNGDVIKIDKKPQTILVDFDPVRMLTLQGLSAKIVDSVNHSTESLDNAIAEELKFFPIITFNAEKLVKVEPTDLVKLITQYNNNKSIVDSVQSVALDKNILSDADIKAYITAQSATSAKNKIDVPPNKPTGTSEVEIPDEDDESNSTKNGTSNSQNNDDKADKDLEKKFRMCIARLSFYAFLSKSKIGNLQDIVDSLQSNNEEHERNQRIFNHLQLNIEFVKKLIDAMSRYYVELVNDALKRADILSHDDSLDSQTRALNAIRNFNRFSDSEIVTPHNICDEMVNSMGADKLKEIIESSDKILDIASKTGEFALAIYALLKDNVDLSKLKNGIYSIPTSGTAYEFTRHIYEVLALNIETIADPDNLTAYDLLKVTETVKGKEVIDFNRIKSVLTQNKMFSQIKWNDVPSEGVTDMINFGAVVGNPPYQEESNSKSISNGQKPRTNIFHLFQILAQKTASSKTVLIFPGKRWLHQSGKGVKEFGKHLINSSNLSKIIFYPNSKDIFSGTDISDGVTIVVTDKNKNAAGFEYICVENGCPVGVHQDNPGDELPILDPQSAIIVNKIKKVVKSNNFSYLFDSILPRSLFGIESDFIEKKQEIVKVYSQGDILREDEIKLLANDKAGPAGRSCWFIVKQGEIKQNANYISEWQVVVSSAHPGGQEGRDNQATIIDNRSAFGRSRVALKSFKSKQEAENFLKYINCPFIKFTFLLSDEALSSLAKLVPDINDYTNGNGFINFSVPIADINAQLYEKYGLTDAEIAFIESKIKSIE